MYHTGPLSGVRLLAVGVPVVVLGRFDAENVLQAIETYGAETSVMVPTHFVRLLALPDEVRARYDVSSVKWVGHTGAACPIDVKRRMIEWWGPVFFDAYGATEVGHDLHDHQRGVAGAPGLGRRAIPPFTAIVVDDDGNEVPAGTEGRLYFEDATGRGVVYPNDPQKTADAHLAPGRVHPRRDRLRRRRRLRLHHRPLQRHDRLGRGEHLSRRGRAGADRAPRAWPTWPCIGVPHQEMGEEVKALVVPADPARPPAEADLIAYCRERLAGYKCPRTVEIVDTVGRTAMGKVNKRALASALLGLRPHDRVSWGAATVSRRTSGVAGRGHRARHRAGRDGGGGGASRVRGRRALVRSRHRGRTATTRAVGGPAGRDRRWSLSTSSRSSSGGATTPATPLVDIAAELGVRHVLVASGPASRAAVVERYGELCRRAEPAGVQVVLEFLPIFTIATLADALGVVQEVDSPNGGVLVDTLHLARSGGRTGRPRSTCRRSCSPTCRWPTRRTGSTTRPRPACATKRCTGGSCPGRAQLPLGATLDTVPDVPVSVELRSQALMQAFPDPTDRARAVLAATQRLVTAPG